MSHLAHNVRSTGSWKRGPARRRNIHARQKSRKDKRTLLHLPIFAFRPRRVLWKLAGLGFTFVCAGAIFLTISIAAISRDLPEPGRLIERAIPVSTKIYDREGKIILYDIHGDIKRTPVSLDKIAPYAKQAAIVAEDKDFYKHEGFRLKSIIRALLANITHLGAVQGGSTITQQFVKNAVLTREKTLTRKLKELVLSYKIEKRFSKDEILNMYFNEIPYGSTIYGIEAASQSFFNKPASNLNLSEAAILAALPKSPTRLSPYGNHTDELASRSRYIIKTMAEQGYITKELADQTITNDILADIKPRGENILAPHFVLYVREQLVEKYGESFVERGGLKIITSLDWRLQQIAEEETRKGAENNEKKYNSNNAALVAQNPKTGQILAMVGSRDYFDEKIDGNVNVALRPRQPGSSFKPIVYAAAFEKGLTPETLLWDVVTTFKTEPKDYEPHNYNGKEHGLISIRQALAGSLNIPAVKTIYLTGVDRVLWLAEQFGYTTLQDRSRFGLSLVLGGAEVKLIEHTGAFAALANDGQLLPQATILRVEDSAGRVLEQWEPSPGKTAVSQTIAREIISILSDNSSRAFIFGTNSPLILSDRPVAAKTGTTNDWHDGWTMGFTPSLAAGVWTGNNNNDAMKRGADGVLTAAPIWNGFMSRALKDLGIAPEQFPSPDPRPISNPILRGQGLGAVRIKVNKNNGRLATDATPSDLIEERVYQSAHSELFYLNKDDLNAPPPENPGTDPNFENWETAVRRYAEEHNWRAEPAPTEYDVPVLPVSP